MENRSKALAWWRNLNSSTQLVYWQNYQSNTFTPSHSPTELTGREIEEIWAKENPIEALPDEMINVDFDGIEEEHCF